MDLHAGTHMFHTDASADAVESFDDHYRVRAQRFSLTHPFGDTEFLRNGWNSWSSTRWWHTGKKPWRVWDNPNRALTAEDAATDSVHEHTSYMVTAVTGPAGSPLVVGALEGDSPKLTISASEISAECESSDALWFVAVGDEQEILARYVHELMEVRKPAAPLRARHAVGPIWSSWYSWSEEITEQIITQEIEPARELGYGALQIDDGWERAVGDWRPNEKFPGGIAAIADEVHDAGLKMGLWLAPFIALPGTPVVDKYPELFLKDSDGALLNAGFNWQSYYYALDFSNPLAHEWLAETVGEVVGWGIDMFKLDFIYAAALQAQRAGKMGRDEAYRAGLATIRSVVGPDVYLLGSGAVLNASVGVLDGIRVGPDTAPYWDNTERKGDPTGPAVVNALRSSLSRTWLKPLFDVDPDVAYFRTRGSLLSPEVNALTADAGLACEFAQSSDPAQWLDDDERAAVRRWTADARGAARVEQVGRYAYRIGERLVDFDPFINPVGRVPDRLLVK